MTLSVFDLHCDTAERMLLEHQGLSENHFAVSLEQAKKFDRYIQVMAHYIDRSLSDEDGWQRFLAMRQNLLEDPSIKNGDAVIATECPKDLTCPSLILSLEDARILANRIDRVDALYDLGIRIITPLWADTSCIGGAHNVSLGLTDFGKAALVRALELGIILDISHASVASAEEMFELAATHNAPIIASHSNAYSVCPVSRNLRDGQVQRILDCNGLIGLNFYKHFLRTDGSAGIADVLRHAEHFLSLGARDALCLGGDMDGCELPPELPSLSSLDRLANAMLAHNYTEDLVRAIFFGNAYRFAQMHLKKPREDKNSF